jgi:hypothetical protein
MANLSTTSPWIEAGKGIQSAIGNVGAIQGIMRQKNLMEREEQEAPLRMQNLQRQGKLQDIQLQEAEIGNKPVYVDETLGKMFPDRPMTKQLYGEAALPFMETDPEGRKFVRNKNVPKVFEQINSVPFAKRAAVATLADIDLQLQALQPKKDAAGQEIPEAPDMKVQREFAIKKLNEQKNSINKLYGLMEGGDLQEMVDEKGVSHWYDKKNQRMVPELDGLKGTRATTGRPTVVAPGATVLGPDNQPVYTNPAKEATPGQATIYGPGGATQIVPVEKGKPYSPPKGWSLKAPSATEMKPDYTPKQAMARVSAIDSAISRMKTTGMVDTATAIQNPLLAGLVDTKDPEAVKQAILSLEAEREEVIKYVPKGYGEKVQKPATSGASDYIKRSLGGH